MGRAKELFLFITIICWGSVIGGILYSHIVYFPPYLSHLPESTALITGPFGLNEAQFWMLIHPLTIISLIITLILNWKQPERKKYLLMAAGIYVLAIIATAIYFVPELMAFADSAKSSVSTTEWNSRGQMWQYLSWIRGAFMYGGFIILLIALTKKRN